MTFNSVNQTILISITQVSIKGWCYKTVITGTLKAVLSYGITM